MSRNSRDFDVLIVGGGVAGAAAAIALAGSGWRTAILHRKDRREGLETISPQAARFLDDQSLQLGVPLDSITAWWGSSDEMNRRHPGSRIISRLELGAALRERARSAKAVQFDVLRHLRINRANDGWRAHFLNIEGEHLTIDAHYAVDASGPTSFLGKQNGAHRLFSDELWSVTATLPSPGLIGNWTESTESGWWNLCSVKERGVLCFFGQRTAAEDIRQNFMAGIQHTAHLKRLTLPQVNQIRMSLCSSSLLQPCAGERWIAVGDATFNVHPLGSAGVARALRDAQLAPQALKDSPAEYEAFQRREYKSYLTQLERQYTSERRWPQSPFWTAMSNGRDLVKASVL